MSTKYQKSRDVPVQVIIQRLRELSDAVTGGRESQDREFTMRIPAECDRDADLVIAEAARRIEQAEARVSELVTAIEDIRYCHPHDEARYIDAASVLVDENHKPNKAWLLRQQAAEIEKGGGHD